MKGELVLLAYVIFSLTELGWETLLTFLNIEEIRRNKDRVPEAFAGFVDTDTYARSAAYSMDRNRFSLVSTFVSGLFTLGLVVSGSLGVLDGFVSGFEFHPFIRKIAYVLIVMLVFKVLSLPFSVYSQFVIEERHGFNKMTPRLFCMDVAKEFLVTLVLAIPLLSALFWFLAAAGGLWWLWAFSFLVVFQLVVTFLYPLIVAPLFNKFVPLDEGPLKARIVALTEKLAFRIKGIFVMDGSKRSRHSNAYFTGLGGAKRIVLFDTLIRSLNEEETAAVLAHEIGHERKRHIYKMLGLSLLLTLGGLLAIDILRGYAPLFEAFGFSAPGDHGIFVILVFCSGPFTFFLTPLFNVVSRRHEYEADRFAAVDGGLGAALKSALVKIGKENLTNLTPHRWYGFYHYSHPAPAERLGAIDALMKRNDTA